MLLFGGVAVFGWAGGSNLSLDRFLVFVSLPHQIKSEVWFSHFYLQLRSVLLSNSVFANHLANTIGVLVWSTIPRCVFFRLFSLLSHLIDVIDIGEHLSDPTSDKWVKDSSASASGVQSGLW